MTGRVPIVLALVLGSAPAIAQRPPQRPPSPGSQPADDAPPAAPDPGATEEARRLFEAGVAQLEDLEFSAAVTTFERSLGLRESPAAMYNLALAQRGAGLYLAAIETFGRFKTIATARHAPLVAFADRMMPTLRAALGRVRLTVRGGSSEVRLDDEVIATGDGTREMQLDPGRHRFVASRDGYAPAETVLELARGQAIDVTLDVSTTPLPGRLSVETGLRSAQILVNGERRGLGDYQTETRPGRYRVEVRATGFLPQRRDVVLQPGGTVRVAVTMARRAPLTHRWWFWTAIGVVVTGAVATVLWLAPPEGDYEDGTLGFTVEALSWR